MDDIFGMRKGLYLLFFLSLSGVVCVSIRYSLPEEKKRGSLVANVLKDLKFEPGELLTRRAQLVSNTNQQYFRLDPHSGNVLVNEKIDREALCGLADPCLLLTKIALEKPLEVNSIELKIEDVNDNSPKFSKNELNLEVPENVPTNTRFPLESAQDPDLGGNSVQNYTLSPNEHFRLDVQSDEFGSKYVDLVLEKPLDREKQAHLGLTLTAVDGGVPQRTGTVRININVLDINDNFPEFTQSEYKVQLKENSPEGTLVFKVEARDLDFGSNAQITYSFHRVPEKVRNLFQLHQSTGEITVLGPIDYEEETSYYMNIKATDGGGLSGHCKVLVEIEDENDNAPEVSLISTSSTMREDSPLDTVVALFSVTDRDSGENSKTSCSVETNIPFALKATGNNNYQLMTQRPLDREKDPEYNITITATDWGSPRLTSKRTIRVLISDINDNPPEFEKSKYEMQLWENNIPGLLMGSVRAVDLDVEENAKVTYSLLPSNASGAPMASYVSINSETGNLYVLRSLDYEQIKDFQVTVRASDGGSPPLSSEAVVRVSVLDENDNAPFFLYPLQNSTSPCNDLVPKSVEAGYLVAKVVAVDGDSGQNSWLSYELLKATDPSLFSLGAQNGEVRTRRALTERDTNKQRLIIQVRDNGHPPQTSTATLNILPVDGFSDPYMNIASVSHEVIEEEDSSLTMYLVVCLAAVSFVFLICIILFVVIKMHKKESSFITALPHFPPTLPEIPETGVDSQSGSLSRNYRYDVCLTGGSLSSEFRFLRPLIPVFSVGDPKVSENHRISSGSQVIPEQVEGREPREQYIMFKHKVVQLHNAEQNFREYLLSHIAVVRNQQPSSLQAESEKFS
ncbi:protocadherin beta-16-like [Eublepharis macularius]|uniref:Protocadherin beta-1 n=1 Tax=Eublepharis macularius TaxID=481883 RepID=A0AA97L3C1_EUBMA|nr:protocadherin beta-16-like [Eublepharis macularius]